MSEIPHGTITGYTTRGCRCRLCTTANTDQMRAYRRRIAAEARAYRALKAAFRKAARDVAND